MATLDALKRRRHRGGTTKDIVDPGENADVGVSYELYYFVVLDVKGGRCSMEQWSQHIAFGLGTLLNVWGEKLPIRSMLRLHLPIMYGLRCFPVVVS